MNQEASRPVGASFKVASVWLALVFLTVAVWLESRLISGYGLMIAIISMTSIKVVLVISSYMEIRNAPIWLKSLCAVWVATVFIGIFVILK
ncbi:cytochrome C oxidase subunit IV family protein [Nocardia aobensis]|uniref:Cytochrome C oxidase subunit IV family protein n=1 Tax=Nocardia aobensis TaxID=257277 RepID=A0ABW6NYW1_9NOCA